MLTFQFGAALLYFHEGTISRIVNKTLFCVSHRNNVDVLCVYAYSKYDVVFFFIFFFILENLRVYITSKQD